MGKGKVKTDTSRRGTSNQAARAGASVPRPPATRSGAQRSGRQMTHLRTKGQFIIRLRTKGKLTRVICWRSRDYEVTGED